MNLTNAGGWLQILMGLVALAAQGYSLFTGGHVDTAHIAVGTGLLGGGVAHLTNGRH